MLYNPAIHLVIHTYMLCFFSLQISSARGAWSAMPVVSPVAASACGPMEIEALPRSPGGEKRRLVRHDLNNWIRLTLFEWLPICIVNFKIKTLLTLFLAYTFPILGEDSLFNRWIIVKIAIFLTFHWQKRFQVRTGQLCLVGWTTQYFFSLMQ